MYFRRKKNKSYLRRLDLFAFGIKNVKILNNRISQSDYSNEALYKHISIHI